MRAKGSRLRLSAKIVFPCLLLLMIGRHPVLTAFGQYVQPLHGWSWPTTSVPVSIESAATQDMRQAVLDAMTLWNLSQDWFITTYMGGAGQPYKLQESSRTGADVIMVTFNETQRNPEYWGYTWCNYWWDSQGYFTRVDCRISLSLKLLSGKALNKFAMQDLVAHEFGHALGIDHTTISGDLMDPASPSFNRPLFPSTLNLYGVYWLWTHHRRFPEKAVSSTIPYQTPPPDIYPPEVLIPEFASPAMVILATAAAFTIIIKFSTTRSLGVSYRNNRRSKYLQR